MGYGAGDWSEAYDKARNMVSKMTLEEMNNITIGYVNGDNGCVGKSGSVPRLGFPGFCLHDAGNGVRATDGVNAYASGVSIGASWNASLAYVRGQHMGREFRKKGVHVALGPVVGPIGRIATGGKHCLHTGLTMSVADADSSCRSVLGGLWRGSLYGRRSWSSIYSRSPRERHRKCQTLCRECE
jgi:hypothetical protein